jgi:RNA polymerase sigma factor (sigma-70 family)
MSTHIFGLLRQWPGYANGPARLVALRAAQQAGLQTGHNAQVNLFSPQQNSTEHRSEHSASFSAETVASDEAAHAQARAAFEAQELELQAWVTRIAQASLQRGLAEQALASLYDATVQRVYSLVRRFVPNDAAAQDVTQEVYMQAWAQAERFDAQRGTVMAWLLNLARSRALDAWRKQSASPVLADSGIADNAAQQLTSSSQPLDLIDAMDTRCALHAALAQLPALTRQMLSLAFFQDMSHQQISDHLRMPLGTVKSTVRRALLTLREHLQQTGLGPEHLASLSFETMEDIA